MATLPNDNVLDLAQTRLTELWLAVQDAEAETGNIQSIEPDLILARMKLEQVRTLRSIFEKLDEIDTTLQAILAAMGS